jgi:hypothetical protein
MRNNPKEVAYNFESHWPQKRKLVRGLLTEKVILTAPKVWYHRASPIDIVVTYLTSGVSGPPLHVEVLDAHESLRPLFACLDMVSSPAWRTRTLNAAIAGIPGIDKPRASHTWYWSSIVQLVHLLRFRDEYEQVAKSSSSSNTPMELKVARKQSWLAVSDYLIGLNRAAFSLGNHVALIMRAQENRRCGIKSVMMTMGVVRAS